MLRKTQKSVAGALHALALLIVSVGLTVPVAAQTLGPSEALADGNRLFRDDLYWAALLRYRQAAAAGLQSPVLDYNSGVAHYKARQFERATQHLLKAAESPQLAVVAHYNLGLTAMASGNNFDALTWLRRARDQERSRQISRLATKAIERIRAEAVAERAVELEAEAEAVVEDRPLRTLERDPREFAELDFYARAGFGTDDNAYRTPSVSYIDIADPNQPVQVDPVVQSGSFVPVSVGAKYTVNSFEYESFFARYRGTGRFYSDELLKNADEYTQELSIGTEYERVEEEREKLLFSAFTVAQHNETYYDPDDGIERTANALGIGDRLSYLRYGPELWTRQSWNRFSFNFRVKAQLWNYENAVEVPEYDHEFFLLSGSMQYRFSPTSLLRVSADAYRRYFSDRPSFEFDGTQPLGNPGVEYRYIDYSVLVRQRITRAFWFGAHYTRTTREDAYIGYNDYFRDEFGVELRLRLSDRFELSSEARYRIYNYERAFAFHNPSADRKTLETAQGNIRAAFDVGWNLRLVGELSYQEAASNDTRIAFERKLYSLSLQWDYD